MAMLALLRSCLALLLLVLAMGPLAAREVKVTFLLACDVYKLEGSGPRGGFARLNGAVNAERARGGNLVYAFAGDLISPSLLSGFDQGEHTIALLNLAPPDIFVPGNHEFDFGPDVFRKRMAEGKFPLLAANLRDAKGERIAGFADTRMLEIDGLKIGIVGLTADDSPVKSKPGDLRFTATIDTGAAQARALREQGADFVVAVVHANRDQDRRLFESRAYDLILTGDDHDLMVMYDGRTAMVESKEEAEYVTAVDVAFDVEEKDGRKTVAWWPAFRIVDTAVIAADPATQARTDGYLALLSKELDVVIGRTLSALDSRKAAVRGGETAIGNLIADAMREAVGADVAITNGGGIRGNRQYPAGSDITRRDVLSELPFGNRTAKIEVKGATIVAALENGVSQVENVAGRFPQVSGLRAVYDASRPAGERILSAEIDGKPIDPDATYSLATNDYLMSGGDGYQMFVGMKQIYGQRDAKLIANDVMAYIAARKEVAPSIEGRVTAK
jgi:2',3'-cyclic-nucleotide 2'-phosphodiesterase (5'-nucleotidase family)